MGVIIMVIAGAVECPTFAHVDYVADYLQRRLPEFRYKRVVFRGEAFSEWLQKRNRLFNWHHNTSPLIWKEVKGIYNKAFYIGGASEFWEYCYEYYNLFSILGRSELDSLVQDNIKRIETEEGEAGLEMQKKRRILITGASHPILPTLIDSLLRLEEIKLSEGIQILLADSSCTLSDLLKIVDELQLPEYDEDENLCILEREHTEPLVKVAELFDNSYLTTCHMLISIKETHRFLKESLINWLIRLRGDMIDIAELINSQASRDLRVIILNVGCVCFNANVLLETACNINPRNIVAVTSNLGMDLFPLVSEITNIPISEIGAPPVWGYIGINHMIDIMNMQHVYDMFIPNIRSITAKPTATLPIGKLEKQTRTMGYLLSDVDDFWRRADIYKTEHKEQLCKNQVDTIIELLTLWYGKYDGEIISLGILSDGSFDIPSGTIFSQPAYLNNNVWMPCAKYPLPSTNPFCQVTDLLVAKRFIDDYVGLVPGAALKVSPRSEDSTDELKIEKESLTYCCVHGLDDKFGFAYDPDEPDEVPVDEQIKNIAK